jgi:hypothetical protein
MKYSILGLATIPLLVGFAACDDQDNSESGDTGEDDRNTEKLLGSLPEDQQIQYRTLMAEYESSKSMTTAEFSEKYSVPFVEKLDYDPLNAANLTLIQESPLALSEEGLETLGKNGFVIAKESRAPTFFNAYESIYKADLPVYVTADSILDAIHRSYDSILAAIERNVLIDNLEIILSSLQSSLSAADEKVASGKTLEDLDLYLSVAYSLLTGEAEAPVRGADTKMIKEFVDLAGAASGLEKLKIFGSEREIDFSQFVPRGHYADDPELSNYFKAMMWLGRIDFRLVETDKKGNRNLNREQVSAALLLEQLMSTADRDAWSIINDTIEAFVGQSDNMTILQATSLKEDLKIADVAGLENVDDETIKNTILGNGYGVQRICSHLMVNDRDSGTLPLNASFLLFGQRYVVDSHVFSNLVYDRVQDGKEKRMMPSTLNVAFTA